MTPATSNSRKNSSIPDANTVGGFQHRRGTPTNAGTLAKVLKPATACRKTSYSRNTIYIRNDNSRDVNSSRTARISREVSNSREASNLQHGHRMPDDKSQMPEMPETVWKPQVHQPVSLNGFFLSDRIQSVRSDYPKFNVASPIVEI